MADDDPAACPGPFIDRFVVRAVLENIRDMHHIGAVRSEDVTDLILGIRIDQDTPGRIVGLAQAGFALRNTGNLPGLQHGEDISTRQRWICRNDGLNAIAVLCQAQH